jgi:hypothetical protein
MSSFVNERHESGVCQAVPSVIDYKRLYFEKKYLIAIDENIRLISELRFLAYF